MKLEIGDLVKFTKYDGAMIEAEHVGIVVKISANSIKVDWLDGVMDGCTRGGWRRYERA